LLNKRRRGRPARPNSGPGQPLGTRIRQARQNLGLSLAAVAGTDFSRAFLNQVELGRAQPSTHTLRIIAERLQQPSEYFLEDPEVSTAAVELVLTEAETRLHQGDPARTQHLMKQLLSRPISQDARARGQLILAGAWLREGQAAKAIPVIEEAIATAVRSSWTALQVELFDSMGRAYYLLRRPGEAGRWFDRALETFETGKLKDPVLKARILRHRADLHYVAGEAGEAIAAYQAAIEAAEQVLDMPALAGIYEGLALSFHQTGQVTRALGYAQRSLRIFETLEDVRMSAQLRNNMAEMLLREGRAKEAEPLFQAGIEQLERINERELLPTLLAGAAESALETGGLERARGLVSRALAAAQHSEDPIARVASERVAGRVAHAAGQHADSRTHFEKALESAAVIGTPELRARVTYDFARTLEAQGDAAAAALRFREAYETRQPVRG